MFEKCKSTGKKEIGLFIQAEVVQQASVSRNPYIVQLNIDHTRLVTSVSCTCVYNQSGRCKHVAALIHYVNNDESLSKTNFEQQWGAPTPKQFAKEKYSKGARFEEMFKPLPSLEMELHLPAPSDLEFISYLKIMLIAEAEASIDQASNEIETVISDKVENALKKEDCEICLLNIHNFVEEHAVYGSKYNISDRIELFYKAHIELTTDEIINLCSETVNQAACAKWKSARRSKFSASSNIHKIKIRKSTVAMCKSRWNCD